MLIRGIDISEIFKLSKKEFTKFQKELKQRMALKYEMEELLKRGIDLSEVKAGSLVEMELSDDCKFQAVVLGLDDKDFVLRVWTPALGRTRFHFNCLSRILPEIVPVDLVNDEPTAEIRERLLREWRGDKKPEPPQEIKIPYLISLDSK